MKLENQGAKPTGTIGKIIGRLMNKFHTSLYTSYLNTKDIPDNYRILDIGCGGGKFLNYLSQRSDGFILWGLDHSKEMIDLSGQLNREDLKKGRLKLLKGSVHKIDIANNSLDLVTAFETIQFWPDIDIALSEVFRILDKEGKFLIINRYPKKGTKWWKMANIKSEEDYKTKLENVGFCNVSIDLNFKNGWIITEGEK
ncbi:methyltransferase domain-containing protein [Maribellus comscasis]|uniref:Methyltransferase domain-containing protein n=1 Tax=Maribellus comscasis TaxID=2681766 RepID=A0A6I6JT93_9BACT|nr:class I SAM-dependent methyltransferase [Maribellus comscasis]QGY42923.1 methyltransferase domain-containing protein [Maribellus comscasis]